MKRNTISKTALTYLIVGLLITALTPIISRYYPVSDVVRGFITGLGLTLEVIAIVKIRQGKIVRNCTSSKA
ncbi:MAG: hypothetical protein JWQ28_1050 [Pedobacter sp.]|nr:hypothetical protein [Pedobacter sp.]